MEFKNKFYLRLTDRTTAILLAYFGAIVLLAWVLWPEYRQPSPPKKYLADFSVSSGAISPLPDTIPDLDSRKITLGKMLFHEPRLSHDNTIACSSCHQLEHGGVDGTKLSGGIKGQLAQINTPTVYNSVFNFRQFWNGRAATLQEQVAGPIHNPVEMGSNWNEVIAKLKHDPAYVTIFNKIYSSGITPENIADSIATFVSSLITPNSRFDKFLKGDAHAITPYELSGYVNFKNYGCISCHQGINIGGNLYEKLGVMRDYFKDRGNVTDADLGHYSITGNPEDLHKFKVPSLRNIALTAPYLHDGTARNLEQVVLIMGKYQLGIAIPAEDVAKIVAFLRTLTGEYDGRPL
ncbi:MAG: cytochrome-c peroxidase [Gallionellaceae bacterium]|nr:cytochrome-c peroxidase [Gallionellaceae bacterium]